MASYSQRCELLATSAPSPVCTADVDLDCTGGLDLEAVMRSVGILPASSDNVTPALEQQDPLPVMDDLLWDMCAWAETPEEDNDASTFADLLISSALMGPQQTTPVKAKQTTSVPQLQTSLTSVPEQTTTSTCVTQQHTTFNIVPQLQMTFSTVPKQEVTTTVPKQATTFNRAMKPETAFNNVQKQEMTFTSVPKQQTSFNHIQKQEMTFTSVPKQQTSFNHVLKQEKSFTSVPKQQTSFNPILKQEKSFTSVPKQQTSFNHVLKQEKSFTSVSKQQTSFNPVLKQEKSFTSVPKQQTAFNPVLKQEKSFTSVPKQQTAFNRVPKQEMTFSSFSQQTKTFNSVPMQQTTYYPARASHQSYSSQVPNLPDMMSGPMMLFDQLESANMFTQEEPRVPSPCYSDFSSTSGFSSPMPAMNSHRSPPPAALPCTPVSTKRPCGSSSAGQPTRKRTKKEVSIKTENSVQPPTAVSPGSSSKPSTPYFEMIGRALMSSSSRSMVLGEVYDFILQHYPYFRTAPATWRNAVRHNLTVNDTFVKGERADKNRGFIWSVHPACLDMFSSGDFRRMPARRLTQQSYKKSMGDAGDVKKTLLPASYQQMTYTTVSSAYSSIPSLPRHHGHSFHDLASAM